MNQNIWQPIATAPRDGTPVLLVYIGVDDAPRFCVGAWRDRGWQPFKFAYTHWTQLPEFNPGQSHRPDQTVIH